MSSRPKRILDLAAPFPPGSDASVLFDQADDRASAEQAGVPSYFTDLHLDQIVNSVTASRAEYGLLPFFYWPERRVDAIRYRHEVFRDLEKPEVREAVNAFAKSMREVRSYSGLVRKLSDRFHKEGWLVQTIAQYCAAVSTLAADLEQVSLEAHGLLLFRAYLARYAVSQEFVALRDEAKRLIAELAAVRYSLLIHGDSLTVDHYGGESDYSQEIEETFAKFKQGAAKDYRIAYRSAPQDMNHIEAKILEFVARLNPTPFLQLLDYAARHADFLDQAVARFDREVQFFLAYLDHIEKFKRAGLPFCYPEVSDTAKDVHCAEGFDLALAEKLTSASETIVSNDFALTGKERIIVVSGPNQGGKTTFARMFGQLHHLASLGCPVPGREARLYVFDDIFAHFEREEKVETLRGKLEDDLVRIHAILENVLAKSRPRPIDDAGGHVRRGRTLFGRRTRGAFYALQARRGPHDEKRQAR